MRIYNNVLAIWILTAAALSAAEFGAGTILPPLKGEYLTGRKALLPEAAKGKSALLAIGFTYDSRFAVEAWVKRFREDFGQKQAITFYEIPMIGGMARMGKWFIDSGMRSGTPKELHENVITVYGGVEPWKKRLGYKEAKDAYLILIDTEGKIRWLHHGPFDDAQYAKLAALLR